MATYCRAIACCIALWIACAGMVAFSPIFHHWIEHGGKGRLHLHGKFSSAHAHGRNVVGNEAKLFAHEKPFDLPLPRIDIGTFIHRISQAFNHARTTPESDTDPADHEHNSLPQLLAAGTLEQEVVFELERPETMIGECQLLPLRNSLLAHWNPEPPGRAPPILRG